MTQESAPALPPAWEEMLARVEQALAVAVAEAARREAALQAAGDTLAQPRAPGLAEGLAHFGERLRGLGEHADRAAATVAEADRALASGEDALRAWFQSVEAVRGKLASWAGRA